MSWTDTAVSDLHQAAMEGFEVVAAISGVLPQVEERAVVAYFDRKPWDLLEEFVARAVAEVGGFRSAEAISEFLGFKQARFIEPMLKQLLSEQLVKQDATRLLIPQPGLLKAIEKKSWPKRVERHIAAVLDPFTGHRYPAPVSRPLVKLSSPFDVTQHSPPDVDGFGQWVASSQGPLHGSEVEKVEFQQRVATQGIACEVLVFLDDAEESWGWTAYDPIENRIAPQWHPACEALSVQERAELALGAVVAPEPVPAEVDQGEAQIDRVRELEAALAQAESERNAALDAAAATGDSSDTTAARDQQVLERLPTRAAARRMKELIGASKRELILRFPWVKSGALTGELLNALRGAVRRGVNVIVAWGIASREQDETSDESALKKLRGLNDPKSGNAVCVVWIGHDHTKQLVVDRQHYFVGSFNFLSFRGDPDWDSGKVRQELMLHTNDPEVVNDALDDLLPRIQGKLRSAVEGATRTDSYWEWCKRWHSLLQLGVEAELAMRALGRLPTVKDYRADAISTVLNGIERHRDAAVAGDTLNATMRWLSNSLRSDKPRGHVVQEHRKVVKRVARLCPRFGLSADALEESLRSR